MSVLIEYIFERLANNLSEKVFRKQRFWRLSLSDRMPGQTPGADYHNCIGRGQRSRKLAERYAKEREIPVETFLPDCGQYGKSAPLKRNIQIVEASEQLIAF